jgi:hypothetical protein
MKAKKWLTIVTFICSGISALMGVYTHFKYNGGIVYDFFMAIFGSALLGFIMSLTEYFPERKKAMEKFWTETYKVIDAMQKLKYVDIDEPKDIVLAAIHEEQNNEYIYSLGEDEAKSLELSPSYSAKEKMKQWIIENSYLKHLDKNVAEHKVEKRYAHKIEEYKKQFQECVDSYLAFTKLDLNNLSSAYGSLDFIFANNSIRYRVYTRIYEKINNLKFSALARTPNFNALKEGKGNIYVCAQNSWEISDMHFDVAYDKSENTSHKSIYHKTSDDLREEVEWFHSKIYFKRQPEPKKRIPVLTKSIRLDIND